MDVRTPLFQNIACVLIGVLFLNPLVATAAQLTVDATLGGNTSLDQAGNGVPIVNIATPNGSGLSHNRFGEYNVGQQGLILNNATAATQSTQLGGIILGNPHFNGQAAGLILNEVTGANASQLRGYTEVAGKSAAVIVANPHGISCDGCGFINTPRVTLTTGKPMVENGRLDRFDVDGGQISIDGAGLNASNVDQFDLITRSAKLNAELYAKQLNVITGRNQVKADDLTVTAKAADGSAKPQLAIDSSALGGMYAGAIRLVGTEAGVGVKLAGDMAASAGDIQIDANGQLSLAQTAASRDILLKGESIELTGKSYAGRHVDVQAQQSLSLAQDQSLAARERIELKSGQLDNQGLIEAGVNADNSRNLIGDVTLQGENLRNSGSVIASRELSAVFDGQLDNRAGTLSGKTDTNLTAGSLNNGVDGRVLSQGNLTIGVDELDNSGGLIASAKNLHVTAGADLHNQDGEISSQADAALEARNLNNQGGLIAAGSRLQVTAAELDNRQGGLLSSEGSLTLSDTAVDNQGGAIVAEQQLTIDGKSLDNRGGLVSGKADVSVEVDAVLDNRVQGTLVADGKMTVAAAELRNADRGQVAAKGDLELSVGVLSQQGDVATATQAGELLSEGKLTLLADSIDNRQGGLIAAGKGLDIRASSSLRNSAGEISTQALASIRVQAAAGQPAALLDNSDAGLIVGDQGLELTVQRLLNNARGVLAGRDNLLLIGDSLNNSAGGTLSSQKVLAVQLTGALENQDQGALLSGGSLMVEAASLNNSAGGLLSSAGALTVDKAALNNQGGKLVSDGQLTISNSSLDNSNSGIISAQQALTIGTGQLDNQNEGLISSGAGLTVTAGLINNYEQGLIAGKGAVQVSATGLDQHAGGELISETSLTLDLQGGDLNNNDKGLVASPGALLLKNLGEVDNSAGGEISSAQSFLLKADQLNNSAGRVISGQALELQITQALLNNLKGALSAAKLTVAAASLDNSGAGVLASSGDLEIDLDGKLDNHDQGLISAGQALTVTSASLDNSNQGLLASDGALTLTTGAADNRGGSLASQTTLDATSADLDNRGGLLSSQQALTLTAADVDNRDGGLITSADSLTLTADSLDSSRDLTAIGGEVSAKQALSLTVKKLIQRQGRLIGEAGVSLDLQGGDLDNREGLLFANGPLTVANLRKLDNRGGELSSSQSYSLVASEIDNGDKGALISSGTLTIDLDAGALRNAAGGLISGWQGLTVDAGSLDNSALGTLSSRDGELDIELSGALDNSGEGALVSKGKLTVDAASLDNSDKGILSSEGDLELTLTDKLDNHDGGLIDTLGVLTVAAGEVDNRSGQIGSEKAASVTAASLDNSAGQLSSSAALSLTLTGDLTNTQGAKLASAGPLMLKAAGIDNQGGSLISQNLLHITGSSLNNGNGGTLAARNALGITLGSGTLTNSADGLIHSELGTLDIQAQSLNNNGGALSSQQDLTLNLDGKLDNQSGRIESLEGNLDLQKSSAVDNSSGLLSSVSGWLKLLSAGLFDNDAGTTQAQSLEIDAEGVDNQAGHISALTGDTNIDIGTATFNNQGGGLYAHQLLKVIAGDFNNQGAQAGQGGKVAAEIIDFSLSGALNNGYGILESGSTLSLAAASIDNQYGSLRALGASGDTSLIADSLDNRNGTLETANANLDMSVASLQSSGGSIQHVGTGDFGLSAAQVIGAGGDLSTNGLFTLTADNWTNSGVLQAGKLELNIGAFTQTASGQLLAGTSLTGTGGTWINNGLLASDGILDLDLSGAYSGSGQVTSLGDLSLHAASISLGNSARIAGGGLTNVSATGLLSNLGKLTSAGDLTVTANTLNNYGTLGSAENLRIVAPTLLNQSGLIFSGADMTLWVDNFTNKYADVYSLGALSIAKNDQLAQAGTVENISGTLESAGDMRINAQTLDNRTDVYSLGRELISGYLALRCYDCSGDHYTVDYVAKEFYEGSVLDDSPSAFISSGGNFDFVGGDLFNRQSTISAAGNITVQAANFSNIGAIGGTIERTRIYHTGRVTDGTVERFIYDYVDPYNQRNNPDYPNVYYVDDRGDIRLAIARLVLERRGSEVEVYVTHLFDSVTDKLVSIPHAYGNNLPASQYDPNNLLQLPSALAERYALVSDVEIATNGGEVRSAVVQAGGNVSIQAAQNLENSAIRQDYVHSVGSNLMADTSAAGTGKSTVAHLNLQLPPDLQQQQVNPLTLPGFSLPQGENGLFRLSEQGATSGVAAAAQGATGDNGLSASAVTVDAAQESLGPVASAGSTWSLQAGQGTSSGSGASDTASLSLDGVQSLPSSSVPSTSHKYLIETNPELTNLKQFLGSDYMLGNLGYTPDNTQKRLGDGLYEQRLIREAVVARTGQRFLAGLTSDEAMFRYLMDNAIASKQALNLSLGVTLSAEQVAALTHDIVWLEEFEVNGEKVLVPVLYLAQANNRLGPNGALIQGENLSLITGGDLNSIGTLRASNNFSAVAGGSINNGGLIDAGNRLDMLAADSIRNDQGGIIRGRDLSFTALTGDVLNERSVTQHEGAARSRHYIQDIADSAARIEAANSLSFSAGRDVANIGGVLDSGGDIDIDAGRDVIIASAQERLLDEYGRKNRNSRTTQYAAEVSSGRDVEIIASRDFTAIDGRIDAYNDITVGAGRDMTLASAANEEHFYSKTKRGSKKVTRQEDHVHQQATEVSANGDVMLSANNNMVLSASRVTAGGEAYLVAGEQMALLAAEDLDYSLYDMKKKGSWGSKKTQRDEITKITNVGSEITTGGDLTLLSGGDQTYQRARLESGEDLTLASGGSITFEGVKDLEQESHEKSKNSFVWTSAKGKGNTDETLRQSVLLAQGEVVIKAVEGLKIDIKQVNKQSVTQTIDAMVKADPQLAWLKEAELRGDVDWRRVKEIHESFKYEHSGLGGGAAIIIAIVLAVITAGAGTAIAAAAGGAVGGGTVGTVVGAVAQGAFHASVAQTAISTINNKGNPLAVIKDTHSAESIKGYAVAGISAGITAGVVNSAWGVSTEAAQTASKGFELGTVGGAAKFAGYSATNATVQAGVGTAIQGGSFSDNLNGALVSQAQNVAGALAFNAVGDYTKDVWADGSPQKIALHALVGGLLSEAAGGDFATGAAAAGANEALVNQLNTLVDGNENLLLMASQLVGLTAAGLVDGDLQQGADIAANATTFNYLLHHEVVEMLEEQKKCSSNQACKDEIRERYAELSEQRIQELPSICQSDLSACNNISTQLQADAPKIQALADQLRRSGDGDTASVIGWLVPGSNQTAQDIVTNSNVVQQGGEGAGVLAAGAQLIASGVGGVKPGSASGVKGGSVPNLTERGTLVNLRPNDVAIAQRPVRTLVQDESGRYWLQTSTGKRITPSGSYDFVTMPDGSVRVARPNVNQDFSTHLGLSGGGEVKYAGSIRFGNNDGPSRGTITQWTNNSGHYQPSATLSNNAGLPQGLFNPR
ncbi:filamentous hemagglutinin N-terminal domain-containing protein [Pseudomonas sp. SA3-5]|uniref:Filamentous hemagglutinin N-terminal domain-containing protein n=1 Tax=Pseudomonas aestuarii TaxID=3018340 RepID=A0ABT4XFT0_9PSED|nr:filamentous hemagglutinin N-terminal domain-containing protein [Pseudomonas aestuarii]MDA7087042.1 filamentous hemagglutinin N-terminal domain-containing protein [Pseudomonas aestuarii]